MQGVSYYCLMDIYRPDFMVLKWRVLELLRADDIETALRLMLDFIGLHLPEITSGYPQSWGITLSARLTRINRGYQQGQIMWEKWDSERSKTIQATLDLLGQLELGKQEIEKRNYPHISGLPAILGIDRALERLELLLLK